MNLFNIERSFKLMKQRGWNKIYAFVDIHDTILKPNWGKDIPHDWFPYAKEVLKEISNRSDICLILYTCSHPKEIEQYLKMFNDEGIKFEYVNENPEIQDNMYGCFIKKPYMNIIIDDKAGFEGELDEDGINDWVRIREILIKIDKHKLEEVNG